MNSQQLLYINLGIGLFFVLYFLFFRTKPKDPVRLHLRGKSSEERQNSAADSERQEREAAKAKVLEQVLSAKPLSEVLPSVEVLTVKSNETSLVEETHCVEEQIKVEDQKNSDLPNQVESVLKKENSIYFVYNCHEWECHDVLGVPRGASVKVATEMYQHLIKTSDSSAFPFYEAAFEAILKRKGRS